MVVTVACSGDGGRLGDDGSGGECLVSRYTWKEKGIN